MSLLVIPRRIRLRLEKIQRDFFARRWSSRKKHHLVNWSIMCMANKKGGLGMNLFILNVSLLGKYS